jgi:hypothetical protein
MAGGNAMETLDAVRTILNKLAMTIIDMNDHYLLKFADDKSASFGFVTETLTEALIVGEAMREWRDKVPGKATIVYYADMQRAKRGVALDAGTRADRTPHMVELHHKFFCQQPMYRAMEKVASE